jgi:YidC/Oxa1 family membrane protein insertase
MRNQTQVNPQMQIIGKVMPVIFGFISLNIPAGVVLYFLTSNIWQIGQQELVYRTIGTAAGPPKGKADKAKVGKGDGPAPPVIEAKSTEATPPASGGVKGLFKSLSSSSSASAPDEPAPSENGKPPPSGAKSSGAKGATGKSQPAKRAPAKSAPAKATPSTAKKSTSGGTAGSGSGARRKNNRKRKR